MRLKAGLAVLGLVVAAGCSGTDASGATTGAALDGRRGAGDERAAFEFAGMIGLPRALVGAPGAIRGVNGAGRPWVITRGKGELHADGTLELDARGVVFDPNDASNVAAGLANTNTVATMRGILSCITLDATGAQAVVNLTTDAFPATLGPVDQGGGDVHIEQRLDVPRPCFAPIAFVTSPAGAWFTVTGL